jgi:alkylation response protein AidB-like acyl-CoA dehydrogenase
MATQVSEQQARQVAEEARSEEWQFPSFCKELFLGALRMDLIHPQPKTDEDKAEKGARFLERLRTFLENEVDPLQIERDAKIPDEVIDGLKELGALGMKVPEEYGGLGISQVDYNKALMLAGGSHSAISTFLSAHQSIGVAEPLMLYGSEEQKHEWLPKVAKDHVSAFYLTEPDVGSDPARLTAVAKPSDDGAGYLINGRKLWATNGVIADVAVVMARVPEGDGHKGGISTFIVPCDDERVVVEHRNRFMGLRGIENSVTRFDDVYVPKENLIGKEGQGLKIALETLNTGRLALPSICVGVSKLATKVAREFANARVQWGKPIGKHEAVAEKLSFIAATAYGMEAMLDVSSRLADAKSSDIRIEAGIAKLWGSEMGWKVVDELVQIRGGRGYETAESLRARGEKPVPVEQLFRDMRINRIFEGSSEIMHLLIAREAVDEHLKVAGDILDPDVDLKGKAKSAVQAGAFYSKWLPQLVVGKGQAPTSFNDFGDLATHLRFAERHARKMARSIFWGMSRWQARMEQKQLYLGRIIDIGAELFAIASTVVYTKTIEEEQPDRADQAKELADLFCQQSRRRVDTLVHALWHNDDEENYDAARQILDGRYLWVEEGVIDPSGPGPLIAEQTEEVRRVEQAEGEDDVSSDGARGTSGGPQAEGDESESRSEAATTAAQ